MSSAYQRNITPHLLELMKKFPAIAIIGARQVGKTTLAKTVGHDFTYVDLEKPSDYDRVTRDPDFFLKQFPSKIIFDEAQFYPELFAVLRGAIDEKRQEKGRFIITGSSSTELLRNVSESLPGRIAIIELGTLKANELFHEPLSDFYQQFKQPLSKENFNIASQPRSFDQIQEAWFKGGYPEPWQMNDDSYYQEWMVNYETTYLNRDIASLFPKLDKIAFRRFITMLGELSSKILNKSDIARSIAVTQPTIADYIDIAAGTFIWRSIPSFEHNVTKRIVKMPRGHIRDTGLLHHLLHIGSLSQLQSSIMAGFSFEAFVIEEILKGLQDARIQTHAYYYRTYSGAEIDLVLEGNFGILPIEIKYGSTILARQLRAMTEFIQEHHLPFGVVVNQAEKIEWLTKDIIQVPVGYL
ncbi:MAG: ATP-binding protein [Legionellaceae bacterium]|nr:ATP-binding protein [Legionellaceae bacterium]